MFIRSCLTLLIYTTSTLALARELPADARAAPKAPTIPSPALALAPSGATAPGPASSSMEPDLTPPRARRDWKTEHRWLQTGTGVTWSLVGLGVIGFIVPLGMLGSCNRAADAPNATVDCSMERRTVGVSAPIIGVLTLASLVPAILFTRRLVRHQKERHTARLRIAPGGLALAF